MDGWVLQVVKKIAEIPRSLLLADPQTCALMPHYSILTARVGLFQHLGALMLFAAGCPCKMSTVPTIYQIALRTKTCW